MGATPADGTEIQYLIRVPLYTHLLPHTALSSDPGNDRSQLPVVKYLCLVRRSTFASTR